MEWEIPEPLNIRPCQKPSELKARQLRSYPVKLKKLPQWVDNATFQILKNQPTQETNPPQIIKEQSNQITQTYTSLQNKYQNKQKYQLIYQRGQTAYVSNFNFATEYIATDYQILQKYSSSKYSNELNITNSLNQCYSNSHSNQIYFDSKFQCGNLSKAYQLKGNKLQFHLLMQKDINTLGYTQWYCFSIKNQSSQCKNVDIRIVNFVKNHSFYKKGMKPWYIRQGFASWKQFQKKCFYRKTNVRNSFSQYYNQLTFEAQIHPGLTFFSLLPLYSYSRLCKNVQKLLLMKDMRLYPKRIYTILNNIVPVLQYIPNSQISQTKQQQIKWYDTIVIFARTHPGQVWASFLMEQFIQTIVHFHKSNFVKIRYLIIPMMNPDGVIYGNFRCDFSGVDLNRVWIYPNKLNQPSIYNIKKLLLKQFESKKAKYFMDFHSHSKSYNVFTYTTAFNMLDARLVSDVIRLSNQNKIFDPVAEQVDLTKMFLILSQTTYLSNNDIYYSNKKSTARAFMCQLTQKGNAMTVQISFYGYINKKNKQLQINPFTILDFNDFSWTLLRKLIDYIHQTQEIVLARKILNSIYCSYQQSARQRLNNISQGHTEAQSRKQISSLQRSQDQDSDSQPQKFYTNETKRRMKQKHSQIKASKYIPNLTKKGYMKQTQCMINRIQVIQKQQKNQVTPTDKKKTQLSQIKTQFSHQKIKQKQVKTSPPLQNFANNYESKEIIKQQKRFYADEQQPSMNHSKQQSQYFSKGQGSLKKIFINRAKKEIKIIKKQPHNNVNSQNLRQIKLKPNHANIVEPLIFQVQKQKKIAPTFGKFLTSTKRNQSRRYRTLLKQQIAIIKKDQDQKRNFIDIIKLKKKQQKRQNQNNSSLIYFLQEQVYVNDLSKNSQIKQQKQFQKESKFKRAPTQISQAKPCIKNRQAQKQKGQLFAPVNLHRKESNRKKHSYTNKSAINDNNKYFLQRKKILQMMKKQTRIYPEIVRQTRQIKQIQDIVQRRKRAKTQISMIKNNNQQKNNVFIQGKMEDKMPKTKHNQKSISIIETKFKDYQKDKKF